MIEHSGDVSDQTLVSIAAYGLAGSVVQLPAGPFAGDAWFRLLDVCHAEGLLGMLSVAGRAGDLALSAAQRKDIAVLDQEMADLVLLVEQEAARCCELLAEQQRGRRLLGDLPVRLNYRTPELRALTTDAVLLTDSQTAPSGTFSRSGETQPAASNQPQVPSLATIGVAGQDIGLVDLAEPAAVVEIAGHTVPTPPLQEHLVLTCMRFHDDPSLVIQRDVAELALSSDSVADRVQAVAEAWGVTGMVTGVLVDVWRRFQLADRTRLSVWAARSEARSSHAPASTRRPTGRMLRRRASRSMGRLIRRRETAPTKRRPR